MIITEIHQWYNLNQNVWRTYVYVLETALDAVSDAPISDGYELISGQGITDRRTDKASLL